VSAEARERECAELRRESERASRGAKAGVQGSELMIRI